MTNESAETVGPEATVCSVSPAMGRLKASLARFMRMIESKELESSLRKVTLANPVSWEGVWLSPDDANVVETLSALARPIPLARLSPKQVAALARLERAGFVTRHAQLVQVTPRGRALGVARARQRDFSRVELAQLRSSFMGLSSS